MRPTAVSPTNDASFDAIVSNGAINLSPDKALVLNDIFRVRSPSCGLARMPWSDASNFLFLVLYEQLMGFGERPCRVVRAGITVMIGLSLAYYFLGPFSPQARLIDSFYFSVVSFSALGYDGWVPEPSGWARYMAAAESFLGVFTFALLVVTFLRKISR